MALVWREFDRILSVIPISPAYVVWFIVFIVANYPNIYASQAVFPIKL
jgi:hypothetical protein